MKFFFSRWRATRKARKRRSAEERFFDEPFHKGKTLRYYIENKQKTSYKVEDIYLWEFQRLEQQFDQLEVSA